MLQTTYQDRPSIAARRKFLRRVLAVVLVGVLWGAGTAYASTWSYTVDVTRTTAGIKDFTYRHQILWSGNGSTISSYQASDWSQYTAVGWAFTDLADEGTFTYTSNGVQYKRTTTNAKYKFGFCPVCINNYPWAETTVGAGGQHWLNSSGF